MKSLAPAWIASMTSVSCPSALHITTVALGSSTLMALTASMPERFGITMSIITRSGCSSRNLSTDLHTVGSLAHDLVAFRLDDVANHLTHERCVVGNQNSLAHLCPP